MFTRCSKSKKRASSYLRALKETLLGCMVIGRMVHAFVTHTHAWYGARVLWQAERYNMRAVTGHMQTASCLIRAYCTWAPSGGLCIISNLWKVLAFLWAFLVFCNINWYFTLYDIICPYSLWKHLVSIVIPKFRWSYIKWWFKYINDRYSEWCGQRPPCVVYMV